MKHCIKTLPGEGDRNAVTFKVDDYSQVNIQLLTDQLNPWQRDWIQTIITPVSVYYFTPLSADMGLLSVK